MGLFATSLLNCSAIQNCSEWSRKYMKYSLGSVKDGVSLTLGVISVVSWVVAEIPQIITNYQEKSTEGLAIAFLMTWVLGDLFNLFGCMLEPATLPTQYYTALLYTVTTMILAAQTIYYGHIYHRLKHDRSQQKVPNLNHIESPNKARSSTRIGNLKQANNNVESSQFNTSGRENVSSIPIPSPALLQSSTRRGLYYVSARSLSSSHTPPAGSFLTQRMTPISYDIQNSMEQPLLDGLVSARSAPPSNVKTMLCLVSTMTFLGILNLHQSTDQRRHSSHGSPYQGIVLPVGRRILQVTDGFLHQTVIKGGSGMGEYLGWAMAAIYMGGRLPQICLNIKRGNAEGLSPLMFIFALIGNATYVGSILVKSLDWSRIRPNLPWLVDAGGCVLLDTFILIQFIYFRFSMLKARNNKLGQSSLV